MLDGWRIQVTYRKDEKGLILVKCKDVCQQKAGLSQLQLGQRTLGQVTRHWSSLKHDFVRAQELLHRWVADVLGA